MGLLILIAAVARDGAIGRANQLLWHEPADQRHFRAATLGCPVVMGRRTWDSLPARFRPLPGRRNLVVTRNSALQRDGLPGAEVFGSLDAALAALAGVPRAFVIGGEQLYAQALPRADELLLTEIDAAFDGADAFFPAWPREQFSEVSREAHAATDGRPGYAFVRYRRRSSASLAASAG